MKNTKQWNKIQMRHSNGGGMQAVSRPQFWLMSQKDSKGELKVCVHKNDFTRGSVLGEQIEWDQHYVSP